MNQKTNIVDLSGVWDFGLDQDPVGIKQSLCDRKLGETICLPGSTDQAGFGNLRGREQALAGRLTRIRVFEGVAWYQKEVEIPSNWAKKRINLFLERCHWETSVWIDHQYIGTQRSLVGPHIYTLPEELETGKHRITIKVDNTLQLNIGPWSNSISDETQTNWNGIIGRIELVCTERVWVDEIKVASDLTGEMIHITGQVRNITGEVLDCQLDVRIFEPKAKGAENKRKKAENKRDVVRKKRVPVGPDGCDFSFAIPMGEHLKRWDEFTPNLYIASVVLSAEYQGQKVTEFQETTFGIREITTKGRQLLINGTPLFLRGNIHNGEAPLTGYPSTDQEEWERIIRIAKQYGFNLFRFHSWCPPKAAFAAADRLGFYIHAEGPFWAELYRDYEEAAFLREELFHMISTYGNHPSFIMMGLGNELKKDEDLFNALLNNMKEADPRRLYTCDVNNDRFAKRTSPLYNAEFFVTRHTQYGSMRLFTQERFKSIYSKDGNDTDYSRLIRNIDLPVLSHELGQWAVHPDFNEISKYKGHLKPYNLEYFRKNLDKRGLSRHTLAFQKASGKLAAILYKEETEACLRTPEFGGFHRLQLQDFPGQGDALVGLLDVFWDSKNILTPEEHRAFCCEIVPLVRMEKFVWYNDETFRCKAMIAHYSRREYAKGCVFWKLKTCSGEKIAGGTFRNVDIPVGGLTEAGVIEWKLETLPHAAELTLELGISDTDYSNSWNIWVYPRTLDISIPDSIHIARDYDEAMKAALSQGKSVLLTLPHDYKVDDRDQILKRNFLPVFWTFAWKTNRQEGAMGILCDPNHPAISDFPTDSHSDFQWSELINSSCAFVINGLPSDYQPIVTGIDDFHRGFWLGHILEGTAMNGKVILCGFDLSTDLEKRPVARQMLLSLIRYMSSETFQPGQELDLRNIFRTRILGNARILFSSSQPTAGVKKHQDIGIFKEANATDITDSKERTTASNDAYPLIDGDWSTFWEPVIGDREGGATVHIDLKRNYAINGILYKPAAQGFSRDDAPYEIKITISTTDNNWGQAAACIPIPTSQGYPVQYLFDAIRNGRFIKIEAVSSGSGSQTIAMAELELLIDSVSYKEVEDACQS
jgi:beta-galactosidase